MTVPHDTREALSAHLSRAAHATAAFTRALELQPDPFVNLAGLRTVLEHASLLRAAVHSLALRARGLTTAGAGPMLAELLNATDLAADVQDELTQWRGTAMTYTDTDRSVIDFDSLNNAVAEMNRNFGAAVDTVRGIEPTIEPTAAPTGSRAARRLAGWSVRVLPVQERARYREEFAAELYELREAARRVQVGYAVRQLVRALVLRRCLRERPAVVRER